MMPEVVSRSKKWRDRTHGVFFLENMMNVQTRQRFEIAFESTAKQIGKYYMRHHI
jgi:hypothetical protein